MTSGMLNTVVTEGATIKISAKFGPITVMSETFDVCAISKEHGNPCPLQPGYQSFYLTVNVPSIAPARTYTFKSVSANADGTKLLCLQGGIQITHA